MVLYFALVASGCAAGRNSYLQTAAFLGGGAPVDYSQTG